mmetsp:Transcript_101778/g.287053  ORF Transcript_101778/g.287053 Transcript_101778/m.287053 type:complete len:206 (-) Transcript_101778:190-807(-)
MSSSISWRVARGPPVGLLCRAGSCFSRAPCSPRSWSSVSEATVLEEASRNCWTPRGRRPGATLPSKPCRRWTSAAARVATRRFWQERASPSWRSTATHAAWQGWLRWQRGMALEASSRLVSRSCPLKETCWQLWPQPEASAAPSTWCIARASCTGLPCGSLQGCWNQAPASFCITPSWRGTNTLQGRNTCCGAANSWSFSATRAT